MSCGGHGLRHGGILAIPSVNKFAAGHCTSPVTLARRSHARLILGTSDHGRPATEGMLSPGATFSATKGFACGNSRFARPQRPLLFASALN
jgi:hypothetical protein